MADRVSPSRVLASTLHAIQGGREAQDGGRRRADAPNSFSPHRQLSSLGDVSEAATLRPPKLGRAIERRALWMAEDAAHELPNLPLEDALLLVRLYAENESPKYEKAALRWLERYLIIGDRGAFSARCARLRHQRWRDHGDRRAHRPRRDAVRPATIVGTVNRNGVCELAGRQPRTVTPSCASSERRRTPPPARRPRSRRRGSPRHCRSLGPPARSSISRSAQSIFTCSVWSSRRTRFVLRSGRSKDRETCSAIFCAPLPVA
jgi:hypothetical protein